MILFLFFFISYLVNMNCNGDITNEIPIITSVRYVDLVGGSSVNMSVGPESVAYCKLVSPDGLVFYNDFGRCRLSLDKVVSKHGGYWPMSVAYPGHATFDEEYLQIHVVEKGPKMEVRTEVRELYPNTMIVTCSLPSGYSGKEQLRGCKFSGPHNMMLFASGTTENIATIEKTRFTTHLDGSECSFQINNPEVKDLGFWRCAMHTDQDTYYGFVTVLSSWLLNEASVVATIRQGPLLRADQEKIQFYKGEPVTMSCSIDAPIKYCYFWMSGGTVFNVSPGLKSSSMEYVGSGFDAGECGLKIYDLNYTSLLRLWTCNVALETGGEQQRQFYVGIRDRMEVSQRDFGYSISLSGNVHNSQLEYCRYVHDHGSGFSHNDTPWRYRFVGSLSQGSCNLDIESPDRWSDYDPWTIVAKVRGEDVEISMRTEGLPQPPWYPENIGRNGWQIFGWVMLAAVVSGIILAVSLGPQRNRQWVARRATIVRQSFRRQQPPPYTPTS